MLQNLLKIVFERFISLKMPMYDLAIDGNRITPLASQFMKVYADIVNSVQMNCI